MTISEKELDQQEESRLKEEFEAKIAAVSFDELVKEYKELHDKQDRIIQQIAKNGEELTLRSGIVIWTFNFGVDASGDETLATNSWQIITKKCRNLHKQRTKLVNESSVTSRQINKLEKLILAKARS